MQRSGRRPSSGRSPEGAGRGYTVLIAFKLGAAMQDDGQIVRRLAELRLEHRDLDLLVARAHDGAALDELAIKRMKKRKLKLKDMIAQLESRLIPDMDA